MDKIEKIRAEIERLIKINNTKNGFPAGTLCAVRIEAYEKLLSFLDSLEEEPDNNLEEAVEGTVHHCSELIHYVTTDEVQLAKRLKQFNDGDKVRIIIVKED